MQVSIPGPGNRGKKVLGMEFWPLSDFAALIVLVAMMASGTTAAGAVLQVPGQFPSIQQAVDAAGQGDIIQVRAGSYCENVVINKSDVRLRATPDEQVILTGACNPGGRYGVQVQGTPDTLVSGVEIMGFVVEHFEAGVLFSYVTRSRIHLNDVRNNVSASLPGAAHGILLQASTFNEVTENVARENGHLGIGLANGSSGNTVRGNRLYDNQAQLPLLGYCSLMIWGPSSSANNQIVENEVVGERGTGIMIGPGAPTGNVVGQNRVRGHAQEGIVTAGLANGNVIQQNDARGNGQVEGFDLAEWSSHLDGNIWLRNLGACEPGSGICGE